MINFNDGNVFQLTNIQGNWYRGTAIIQGSFNSHPINLTIGVFINSNIFTAKLYGNIGVASNILFYTDGLNLFVKTNIGSSGFGEFIAYSINSVRGYFKAKKVDIDITKLTEYKF